MWGKGHTVAGLHAVVLNAFSSDSRESSHTAQSSQPISPEQPKLISVMLKMALNIIKALFFLSSSLNIFLSPDNVLEMSQKPGGVIKGTGSLAWSHSKDACIGLSLQGNRGKPGVCSPSRHKPSGEGATKAGTSPGLTTAAPVASPGASPGSSPHIHLGAPF